MTMKPIRNAILFDGRETTILTVPYFSQRENDALCLPCSIRMVIEYYRDYYDNDVIKKHLPALDICQISRLVNADRYSGTRYTIDFLKINDEISVLHFHHKFNVKYQEIKKRLDKHIPSIIVYNYTFMKNQLGGPAHAGVIIGLTDREIILNNPWAGSGVEIPKNDIEPAWEIEKT